ncbi:MAG: hypothetical protein BWX73_00498 [Lentisphaerae bacterium ADurb.Bin082]|nr:MAG: hypothetical protein BWX73_00498 [Lentisphaerae bacterium ADurb.Bin082]
MTSGKGKWMAMALLAWLLATPFFCGNSAADDTAVAAEALRGPGVSIHDGSLISNETWTADAVHVVQGNLRVPPGIKLTILDGTIVKFVSGAGLLVESGGALGVGACVFTHIADDEVGGDTNGNGDATQPETGRYAMTLNGTRIVNGNPDFRYVNPASISGLYAMTVVNGSSDASYYFVGARVQLWATLAAGVPASEYNATWSSNDVAIDPDPDNPTRASLTMPLKPVTVTVTLTRKDYPVIVTNGTASVDRAVQGATVRLTATLPTELPASEYAVAWSSKDVAGITPDAADHRRASFVMPSRPVAILATVTRRDYPITVINGAADVARAVSGVTVTVTAAIPDGQCAGEFDVSWSSPEVKTFTVDKSNPIQASFLMPSQAVTVTAKVTHHPPPCAERWTRAKVLDTRTSFGRWLVRGETRISPVAAGVYPEATLTVDNQEPADWRAGHPFWNSANVADGWHEAALREYDDAYNGEIFHASLAVLNAPGVVLHGGRLVADETWAANKLHIVQHNTRVPARAALSIEPGAIVKFCPGAGLYLDEGAVFAVGPSVFTHIADDTAGGDTNLDGEDTRPAGGQYALVMRSALILRGNPDFRYLTQATAEGLYRLTVVHGRSNEEYYFPGATVRVQANLPGDAPADEYAVTWSSKPPMTITADVADHSQATLVMPASPVEVTATITRLRYALTVVNGDGSGDYRAGEEVTVTVCEPDWESVFVGWHFEPEIAGVDPLDDKVTFAMPGHAVTATAQFVMTVELFLARGWNFLALSAPLTSEGMRTLNQLRLFALRQHSYTMVPAEKLRCGETFWTYSPQEDMLRVECYVLPWSGAVSTALPNGWKYVGLPSPDPAVWLDLEDNFGFTISVWSWQGGQWVSHRSVLNLIFLEPFVGYCLWDPNDWWADPPAGGIMIGSRKPFKAIEPWLRALGD